MITKNAGGKSENSTTKRKRIEKKLKDHGGGEST